MSGRGRGAGGGRGSFRGGRPKDDRPKELNRESSKGVPHFGGVQPDNKARVNPQIPLLLPPRSKSTATVKERLDALRWKEVLGDFLSQEYGGMGRLLESGEVPYEKEPSLPTTDDGGDPFDRDVDPHHFARTRYTKELEATLSANSRTKRDLPAVYAAMWDALSTASQLRVSEGWAEYRDVRAKMDPAKLWARIEITHLEVTDGIDATENNRQVLKAFMTLQQGNDNLTKYTERFTMALRQVITCNTRVVPTGAPTEGEAAAGAEFWDTINPSPAFQARLFLEGLNKAQFAELTKELRNDQVFGGTLAPKDLQEAIAVAGSYSVVGTNAQGAPLLMQAVFSTHREKDKKDKGSGRGGRGDSGRGDGGRGGGPKRGDPPGNPPEAKRTFPPCALCAGPHWTNKCPDIETAIAAVKKTTGKAFPALMDGYYEDTSEDVHGAAHPICAVGYWHDEDLGENDVILDNQSEVHIFHNSALLFGMHKPKHSLSLSGITDKDTTLMCNLAGRVAIMRDVTAFFNTKASVNVLSQALLEDAGYRIEKLIDTDYYDVVAPTSPPRYIRFTRKGKHYACDFSAEICRRAVPTIAQNASHLTKREIEDAQRARLMTKRLGYASDKDFALMISSGALVNSPITVQDIHRAEFLFGKEIPSLKGKSTARTPLPVKGDFVPKMTQKTQILHTDVMHIQGACFLISVLEPLGLTFTTHLTGGPIDNTLIFAALKTHLDTAKSENFEVSTIRADGAKALGVALESLTALGYTSDLCGPGQHIPIVERKLRQVKERVRAIMAGLPYMLPLQLLPYLVNHVVMMINMLPSTLRVDKTSPREAFTGRKCDAKRDLRAAFGDYVQATVPETSNDMTPRTDGAIALHAMGNRQGSFKFLNLRTGRTFGRDRWTPLPTPPAVIDYMNKMASATKGVSTDPIFTIGQQLDPLTALDATPRATETPPANPHLPPLREVPLPHDYIFREAAEEQVITTDVHLSAEQTAPAETEPGINTALLTAPSELSEPLPDHGGDISAETGSGNTHSPMCPAAPPGIGSPKQPATLGPTLGTTDGGESEPRLDRRGRPIKNYKDLHVSGRAYHISVRKALTAWKGKATDAMTKELYQLAIVKKAFHPILIKDLSTEQKKKIIRSSMFLKEKFLPDGTFEKLKARLVAGGDMQDRSIYGDVSSPTVSSSAVFIVAGIAAAEKRKVKAIDFTSAYLNAVMTGILVHVALDAVQSQILCAICPEYTKFLRDNGTMVVLLDKALYGCIESARLWYEELAGYLISLGYVRNPNDWCVFNRDGIGVQCTVCFHVDDLFISCCIESTIDKLVANLTAKYKQLTVRSGEVHQYLGMVFDFRSAGKVSITMQGYVDSTLKSYNVTGTAATPATERLFQIDAKSTDLPADKKAEFHSRVARLLYLAKKVRPDMLTAVSFLTTRVQFPTEQDWQKLERLLQYLNGTKYFGITLCPDSDMTVHGYADAAYGVHSDAKSHTGSVICLGKGPIHSKSSKQKLVTKSSTEAELVGASDSASQVLWTRNFLIAQGYKPMAAKLHQDNQSTMMMLNKGKSTNERTRHIHTRYYFVKDRIDSGELQLWYTPTTSMIADILTKPLQGELFRRLRRELLNWDDTAVPSA